jgi:hypothetical protein
MEYWFSIVVEISVLQITLHPSQLLTPAHYAIFLVKSLWISKLL